MNHDELKTVHGKLRRRSDSLDLLLLNTQPASWLEANTRDVRAAMEVSPELLQFVDTAVAGNIFPRLQMFTMACLLTKPVDQRATQQLVELQEGWADLPIIERLSSYRAIKDRLRHLLPLRKLQLLCIHEMMDEIVENDVIHIAAHILALLCNPESKTEFLSRKPAKPVDQNLVDLLHSILDFQVLASVHSPLLRALLKLSAAALLFPQCLIHEVVERDPDGVVDSGGFGYVYKGRLQNQAVAIKVMRNVTGPSLESAFVKEAILWTQLHHANVLPFYGVYFWKQEASLRISLLSPWMENGNIMVYLEKAPRANKRHLILDIASGLQYLHGFRPPVIHGDLKGNNILVNASGRACLADFGLVKLIQDEQWRTPSTALFGVDVFLAPELVSQEGGRKTLETDVYAFACLCYQIYEGKPRFSDLVLYERLKAIIHNTPYPKPQAMHDELWDWVNRFWNTDPKARPTIAAFLDSFGRSAFYPNYNYKGYHEWDGAFTSRLRSKTFMGLVNPSSPTLIGDQASIRSTAESTTETYFPNESVSYCDSPLETMNVPPGPKPAERIPGRTLSIPITITGASKQKFNQDDIIIALMGPTGTGKSTFINCAMGTEVAQVGHGLRACTKKVDVYACNHPDNSGKRVFLVDTPGFSSSLAADRKALTKIAKWLASTYKCQVTLSGVLQFYNITAARMGGDNRGNLKVFTELCGPDALKNVVVVTTGWEELDDDQVGADRQEQLQHQFLPTATEQGCRCERFEHQSLQDAWDVIDLFHGSGRALQIQVEMVDQKKSVYETAAFQAVAKFWRRLSSILSLP